MLFAEAVFSGSWRRPKYAGSRTIEARIVADSYGAEKQQHTFTLEVIAAAGYNAPEPGAKILRKGRNLYRNTLYRAFWPDESERPTALAEKCVRGDQARAAREARIATEHLHQ